MARLPLAAVVSGCHGAMLPRLRSHGYIHAIPINDILRSLVHVSARLGRDGPAEVLEVHEQVLNRLVHDDVDALNFLVDWAEELLASGGIRSEALTG